jgi:hypothetical protein
MAFLVTFIGVTANLWMLHWLPRLVDQRDEVTEPSGGGPSRLPLLASVGNILNLRIDELTNCNNVFNVNP